jgi:hypothetical protein
MTGGTITHVAATQYLEGVAAALPRDMNPGSHTPGTPRTNAVNQLQTLHRLPHAAGRLAALAFLAWLSSAVAAGQDNPSFDRQAQAKRRPNIYLTVFNNGYGGDPMPQEAENFERLLKVITEQGHFNAVMCKHSPQREALCKKYGVLMVVDLLADGHHVYKNPKEAESLCTSLRNNPTVVAYHLWSDRFGKTGSGRARDVNTVHQWDPTHATYSGTYQNEQIRYLTDSDFVSYYDFCWSRGTHKNFPNLLGAWNTAKGNDNRVGRYIEADAGQAGKGNYNRALYTQNTSIACGLRACLWFIGSRIMDMNTIELNALGQDIAKTNAWTKPLWSELPKLGLPTAIYSTPVTKDCNNGDVPPAADGKPVMPPGLENNAFPKDFWIQPLSGEFVAGVSKYDGATDAIYVANHNAYSEQNVKLMLSKPVKVRLFDRQAAKYRDLEVKDAAIQFKLEPAGGQLVLFQ